MGNFKRAIDHLTKINELDEKFTRADKMLSVLFDYKVEKKHYEKMINKMKLNLNN